MVYAQSIIKLTHVLLSSLHLWSLDQTLDTLFVDKLKLQKPKYPVAFGRVSRGSHLFVMFPPKRLSVFNFHPNPTNYTFVDHNSKLPAQKSINLIHFGDSEDDLKKLASADNRSSKDIVDTPSPTGKSWLSAKTMTTEHLLTILSVSNSFMNLQTFIELQIKKEFVFRLYLDFRPTFFVCVLNFLSFSGK